MGQVLLVRHGQADSAGADYDRLIERGFAQCRALGASLARRSIPIDAILSGGMRRHAESATALLEGYSVSLPVVVDHGWDEFDHLQVLSRQPAGFGGPPPDARAFQAWFESAVERWTSGEHDLDYPETFTAFTRRVDDALAAAAARAGCTIVVTSGGAIGWSAASLTGKDLTAVDRARLWRTYNTVCANTGVTRIVSGRRGLTMVSFNEQAHLDGTDLLTYR